ncbi:MAG: Ldh family oxidoreductase [Spirochaetaceae bacterium]|nr:MAG: Ldh family oxidoreductase [Spirochaetaceae bacterium]
MNEQQKACVGKRIPIDALHEFCTEVMVRHGLTPDHARATADVLVTTDTWGVFTHGTRQIVPLMNNVDHKAIDATAQPEIASDGPSWAIVDGHGAMPPASGVYAMDLAIEKARRTGIAYVGVKHSNHFGAAGYYAVHAARQGLIGLSMSNVDVCMTVPFARAPSIGTNPISYAVPVRGENPVFLDIATSVVAISKVLTAKAAGTPIPDNWLVDENGQPTTDASSYPGTGSIVPMTAHKGYGIAFLIEVLSGILTGASFLSGINRWIDPEPKPADQGQAYIAVDVDAMMAPHVFADRMKKAVAEIRSAPKAAGHDRVYLPGEMEWERRDDAVANGLLLPDYVLMNLFTVADKNGLSDRLIGLFG